MNGAPFRGPMVRANSASNISTFLRKFGGCLTSHTAALGLGNNAARHSGAFPAEHGFLLSGYRLSLRCPRASLCSPGSPSCTTDAAWRLCEAMQRGFGAVHLAVFTAWSSAGWICREPGSTEAVRRTSTPQAYRPARSCFCSSCSSRRSPNLPARRLPWRLDLVSRRL